MYPDEFVTTCLDMGVHFRKGGGFCRIQGIEVVTLEAWITQLFRKHMATRGLVFRILELRGKGAVGKVEAKDARIGAMSDYYRTGWVYHNPTIAAPLEQQLMSFPRSKLRDLMDAMSNFIYIMENGKLMFNTDEQQLQELGGRDNGDGDEFDEASMYEVEDLQQLQELGHTQSQWEVV
jgi:hypothetical protein